QTNRWRGNKRLSRNLSIGTLPRFASSIALRSNSDCSPSSSAAEIIVFLFFEPGFRPELFLAKGRPRTPEPLRELMLASGSATGLAVLWSTARFALGRLHRGAVAN